MNTVEKLMISELFSLFGINSEEAINPDLISSKEQNMTWDNWFTNNWDSIDRQARIKKMWSEIEVPIFSSVFHILISNQVPQIIYDSHFLHGQGKEDLEEMKDVLKKAFAEIHLTCSDFALNKHFLYFYVNFRRELNRIVSMAGYIQPYNNEFLLEETIPILVLHPSFKEIYVLQGLIADGDRIMSGYSDIYYKKALNGNKWWICNYAAYRLGLFYEDVRENYEMAAKYYELAYRNKENYKALYKIALLAERKKDYKRAYKLYERLVSQLEYVLEYEIIQPIQVEYLFKVYYRLGKICRIHLVKYYIGLDYIDRAIKLVNEEKYIPFFKMFYESKVQEKENCMRKHLNLDAVLQEKEKLEEEISYFEM